MVKSYFGTFHHQIGEEGSGEKRPGFAISPKLSRDLHQARIHTGLHRFTEIGQIFHDKHF